MTILMGPTCSQCLEAAVEGKINYKPCLRWASLKV